MNKFEEIAREMREDIEDIKSIARDKIELVDEDGKIKIAELAEKTIGAINTTIDKLRDVSLRVDDEEKVNELLDRANAKCKEAVEFTKTKISEVKEIQPAVNLDGVLTDIRSTFDKLMQNENVQNAANFVKGLGDEVNNFLNRPEVKEKIEHAKDVTISVAEKGLDALKRSVENDNKDNQ